MALQSIAIVYEAVLARHVAATQAQQPADYSCHRNRYSQHCRIRSQFFRTNPTCPHKSCSTYTQARNHFTDLQDTNRMGKAFHPGQKSYSSILLSKQRIMNLEN